MRVHAAAPMQALPHSDPCLQLLLADAVEGPLVAAMRALGAACSTPATPESSAATRPDLANPMFSATPSHITLRGRLWGGGGAACTAACNALLGGLSALGLMDVRMVGGRSGAPPGVALQAAAARGAGALAQAVRMAWAGAWAWVQVPQRSAAAEGTSAAGAQGRAVQEMQHKVALLEQQFCEAGRAAAAAGVKAPVGWEGQGSGAFWGGSEAPDCASGLLCWRPLERKGLWVDMHLADLVVAGCWRVRAWAR